MQILHLYPLSLNNTVKIREYQTQQKVYKVVIYLGDVTKTMISLFTLLSVLCLDLVKVMNQAKNGCLDKKI